MSLIEVADNEVPSLVKTYMPLVSRLLLATLTGARYRQEIKTLAHLSRLDTSASACYKLVLFPTTRGDAR